MENDNSAVKLLDTLHSHSEPKIIPRSEHPISRKDIDPDVLKVLYRFKSHGFLGYLVGGGVRDLFLGKNPKDFDVATNATPSQIKDLFRNSRIIGHRFRLVQIIFRGGKVIEVSTFRSRSEMDALEETLPDNNEYGGPEEDANRRDLTINALFYDVSNFSVVDYVGGVEDLKNGIIRVIGDPDLRFVRDPVRMMRAIRHATRAGFTIEENTFRAIQRNKDRIWLCPVSRLRDEWSRDLNGGKVGDCVELMLKTGFFTSLFPFYESALQDGETGEHLVGLLKTMDRQELEKPVQDEAYKYAAFLLPWFIRSGLAWNAQKGGPWFTEELKEAVNGALGILDIKKVVRENVAQYLAAQPVLSEIIRERGSPKRLRPRRYMVESIHLFTLAADARGEVYPRSAVKALYKGVRMPKRKRTARRGKPETEAGLLIQG